MATTSPSMPVISAIWVIRREPSERRWTCTITWTAEAICERVAFSGMSMPDISIMFSMRPTASRGLLACTVVIEPSWPVFIACSMSSTSSPRVSPTMIRSGRIRRAFLRRIRWLTSPLPSTLAGRLSMRAIWVCWSCSSAVSSMVAMRSLFAMKELSAFSVVVLPEPVEPETMTFSRVATTACR